MSKVSPKLIKSQLHPRNKHRNGYDFRKLQQILPELSTVIIKNQYGNLTINFADPIAVKLLNKALLLAYYQLIFWDIPDNYLCPPIPGRADYIHYLADLLAEDYQGNIPCGKTIHVLDIGVGANAIYPIIGHAEYGWTFVGSDINATALKMAQLLAQANPNLQHALRCRLQKNTNSIFNHIIKPNEQFALTLCNPPFHASSVEAQTAARRKLQNLGQLYDNAQPTILNFAGQQTELWCEGGERAFIGNMIRESKQYQHQCLWFSTLVSKQETLSFIRQQLKNVNVIESRVIKMSQGQKISRFVAWTFLNKAVRIAFINKVMAQSK